MENQDDSVVTVGIADMTEDLPTGDEVTLSTNTTITSVAQVFTATPSSILTSDALNVQVQDALKSPKIIAVVQQGLVEGLKSPTVPTSSSAAGKKQYTWDETSNLEVLPIRCRNIPAELYKSKLGSGGKGRCIKYQDHWYTPSEFEALCGRGNSKDWKRSIRYGGRTLNALFEECMLTPHAASCTCSSCCDDDSMSGPVRLFVPYKRKRRSPSNIGPAVKKSAKEMKDSPSPVNDASVSDGPSLGLEEQLGDVLSKASLDLDQQHWWPLEECYPSGHPPIKSMIQQAKAQFLTSKAAAQAQAKLQAEVEKKEAIARARMEAQIQLSRALIEAKTDKDNAVADAIAQATADKLDGVQHNPDTGIIKSCQNCSREASMECTDCHQVSYCSPFCQRKDWPDHQNNCCSEDEQTVSVTIVTTDVGKV
ncbi:putative deformed epidermal autoregulatory factor 1-like [Apostichopus japonicus]|uniref:Putative deformed epidermal autoregulatory factor 1-like n=1 Tax=Stichopus japonicus TaxID=307972 RepID=A0A2G8K5P2_STIJA|nr:putative deformed epidermal autoregulatory factor 1-like [Apostichopus japonicus]